MHFEMKNTLKSNQSQPHSQIDLSLNEEQACFFFIIIILL
jgi:hypothetical protein